MKIVIVVEGGLVQNIIKSTDEKLDVIIVDYDTDGVPDEDTHVIESHLYPTFKYEERASVFPMHVEKDISFIDKISNYV